MTTELEDRLRADLRDTAERHPPSADLALRVLAAADKHRRARRRLVVPAAAVAGLAVAVTAVTLAGSTEERDGRPPASASRTAPSTSTGETTEVPQSFASLPLGPPPERPFVVSGKLHDGAQTVVLPGTDAGVVDRVVGGWLILAEHDEKGGGFTSEFGVLDADGHFRPLAGGSAFMQEAAVSPDAREVFINGAAVAVDTGQIVDSFDGPPGVTVGWGSAGVVYRRSPDDGTRSFLWQPDGSPVPLSVDVLMVARDSNRVLVREPRCVSVVELIPNGATSLVAKWCGNVNFVYELSPDGTYVLWKGAVAQTVTGNQVVRFDALSGVQVLEWTRGWEDASHILFPVELHGSKVQIVRCDVSTTECERAGSPVRVAASDIVSFSGVSGER